MSSSLQDFSQMKRMTKLLYGIAALSFALVAAPAGAQQIKIGYVNGLRVESESVVSKRLIEQLRKEFEPRERQLEAMENQGVALQKELEKDSGLKPADRAAKEKRLIEIGQQFEQQRRAFAEEVEARRRDLRIQFVDRVNAIVRRIAEAGKYDLVLQQAVYGSPQIDITEQVLTELAK